VGNKLVQLVEHFGNDSRFGNTEAAQRRQWFIKAKQDNARREELLDQAEDTMLATAAIVAQATEIQIVEFEAQLDQYDQATIKALNENRIRIDEVKARLEELDVQIQDMLARAYVMDDGRRVFLTEDRKQAFDQDGNEITPDELDFDLIGSDRPSWESYSGATEEANIVERELERLEQERQEIHDFQDKVDAARDRLDEGDITKDELDALDAELADAMPLSVRKHTSGFDTTENAPDLKTNFTAPANPAKAAQSIDAELDSAPMPQ